MNVRLFVWFQNHSNQKTHGKKADYSIGETYRKQIIASGHSAVQISTTQKPQVLTAIS